MDKKVKVSIDFDGKVRGLESDLFIGLAATKSEDGKEMKVGVSLVGSGGGPSEIAELIGTAVASIVSQIEEPSIIKSFMLSDIIEALTKANAETRSKIPGEIIKDFKSGK